MKPKSLLFRATAVAVGVLATCGFAAGCGGTGGGNSAYLPYYDETDYAAGSSLSEYNENLFYRNAYTPEIPGVADPFVLQITDPDSEYYGWFYCYGTTSAKFFDCYRSKDLVNWEGIGYPCSDTSLIGGNILYTAAYAPEVIWDSQSGKYYMYASATPKSSKSVNCVMMLLESDSPSGPFTLVSYSDREGEVYEREGVTYTYNDAFVPYLFFDPVKMAEAVNRVCPDLFGSYNYDGYFSTIDPHPFVDDDGQLYFYFVFRQSTGTRYLAGMKLTDYLTPDYSTFTLLTRAGFYDIEGNLPYELESGNQIDEGATVIKHNGTYYLTYSIGQATDAAYSVLQAVSDEPLGPYRKLESSEGAVLLSYDMGNMSSYLSGPGHHSFVTVNGQMYIIYHKHNDPMGTANERFNRHINVDPVQWITIEDKDGQPLDVLYCAPTVTLQPKPEFASDYKNIAAEATVTATNVESGSKTSFLNDGLLSVYSAVNKEFVDKYIGETVFTNNTTITLNFSEYKTVRAVMVYNSKEITTAWREIKEVKFNCLDGDGNEITYIISNLQMDWKSNYVGVGSMVQIYAAASAIAEFNEIQCKSISITIEIPQSGWSFDDDGNIYVPTENYLRFEHSGKIAVPEIVVLGSKG